MRQPSPSRGQDDTLLDQVLDARRLNAELKQDLAAVLTKNRGRPLQAHTVTPPLDDTPGLTNRPIHGVLHVPPEVVGLQVLVIEQVRYGEAGGAGYALFGQTLNGFLPLTRGKERFQSGGHIAL